MSWTLYKCKFINNQANSTESINTNNDLQERKQLNKRNSFGFIANDLKFNLKEEFSKLSYKTNLKKINEDWLATTKRQNFNDKKSQSLNEDQIEIENNPLVIFILTHSFESKYKNPLNFYLDT